MDGWTIVCRASGLPDAQLIKGFLESEDIPADLAYESAGLVCGLTVDGLGEVRVLVPDDYAEAARDALSRRNPDAGPPPADPDDAA